MENLEKDQSSEKKDSESETKDDSNSLVSPEELDKKEELKEDPPSDEKNKKKKKKKNKKDEDSTSQQSQVSENLPELPEEKGEFKESSEKIIKKDEGEITHEGLPTEKIVEIPKNITDDEKYESENEDKFPDKSSEEAKLKNLDEIEIVTPSTSSNLMHGKKQISISENIEIINEDRLEKPQSSKSVSLADDNEEFVPKLLDQIKRRKISPSPIMQFPIAQGVVNITSSKEFLENSEEEEDNAQLTNSTSLEEVTEIGSKPKLGKRKICLLIAIALCEFLSAVVISLQAPFYPQEAEKKGATATEYGLVFGVFELTAFLASPIYGKYINKIGPKVVFSLGIFTCGVCSILFGFLDKVDDHVAFISLSIVIRIVEALGNLAFVLACFTLIALEFPNSVATTFASMETFFGIGLIIGPTIGGALYELGSSFNFAFPLPFIFVGVILLIAGIIVTIILEPNPDKECVSGGYGFFKLMRIFPVAISSICVFSASFSILYISATLEPHIREFGLNSVLTGAVFILTGGAYALSSPFWGWFVDKINESKPITLIGCILVILGFMIIGPVLPFIPKYLWIICLGLVAHGLGVGAILVSCFLQFLKEAKRHGFPDNVATYGLVSSLWTSMFTLGAFLGPLWSGYAFDTIGFKYGTILVIALQLLCIILLITFLVVKKVNEKGYSRIYETESLPQIPEVDEKSNIIASTSTPKNYGAAA